MTAAKKKRLAWRISDIAAAAHPSDRDYVARICGHLRGDVPAILRSLDVTLPDACGVSLPWWRTATTRERAAALVATAKRLRVPQVPA